MNRGHVLRRIAEALGAGSEMTRFDAGLPRDNVMGAGNTGMMVLQGGETERRVQRSAELERKAMLEAEARAICLQIDLFWEPEDDDAITLEDLDLAEQMFMSAPLEQISAESCGLSEGAMCDLRAIFEQVDRHPDDTCPKPDMQLVAIAFEELRAELRTQNN